MVQNTSSTHWNATPLPIWEMTGSAQKEQNQQSLQQQQQQQQTLQEIQQQMRQQQHQQHIQQQQQQQLQQQQQQHQNQSEPDILQNGLMEDSSNQMQMQKVESKKKKKESLTGKEHQQQQLQQLQLKEQQAKEKQKQKEAEKQKKANEKQKKEEKTTQPAAPAPWVGMQNISGTSLSKIQKTEAQRRQIELAAQKEREHQKLEILSKMEIRDVKWNLQMPPAAQVKTLDEIQAEEQNAAEREAAMAKREKKETVQVVGDIWNTGAHSMAWQQPKTWSAAQSNAGFWEEPTKPAAAPVKQPQLLSKSQTMATNFR